MKKFTDTSYFFIFPKISLMYNEIFQIKIIVLNRGYAKISNFSEIIAL